MAASSWPRIRSPWPRIRAAISGWFAAPAASAVTATPAVTGDTAAPVTWRYLPHFLLAAFVARAVVALLSDFRLHSDEIAQYLEPAHYAVFGRGALYWEWVHGARPWLIPGFVAGILLALDALGLGRPEVYVGVVKLGFCLLSLLLPWAMYRFTQQAAGERAARLALLLGCFWYELVVMAHKPFAEFVSAAFLMTALALLMHGGGAGGGGGGDAARRRVWFAAGALLALGAAVRMQYAPAAMLLLALRSLSLRRGQLIAMWGGAALLAALVGVLEWLTWGAPFHSYLVNYLVNISVEVGGSAGDSSRWRLPGQLFAAAGGMSALAFLLGMKLRGPAKLLLLLSAVTFFLHMLPAHREYRFIFLLTPCWLMLLAMLVARAETPPQLRRYGAGALLIYGMLALANIFPWQSWVHLAYTNEKSVHYLRHKDPMFAVMKHLAARDDVHGLLYLAEQAPYFKTGGYYYLHHDVPFYTAETWGEARAQRPDAAPGELVSHIVTEDHVRPGQLAGFTQAHRAGNLVVWRREGDARVERWRAHVVTKTEPWIQPRVSGTLLRLRDGPLGFFLAERHWRRPPKLLEFAERATP
ncbi:MAG: hypothetical protein OD918_01990 [Gammaproteobacteria bacterium]